MFVVSIIESQSQSAIIIRIALFYGNERDECVKIGTQSSVKFVRANTSILIGQPTEDGQLNSMNLSESIRKQRKQLN